MPRNLEKDIREEALRRKQLLETGFALFSEQGIESVSMNAVALAAGACREAEKSFRHALITCIQKKRRIEAGDAPE